MEIWQQWDKYDGIFEVSNLGRIRKGKTIYNPKPKKYEKYICIDCTHKGKRINFRAHRAVAEVFIPNYLNKPYVNHIDHNRSNNAVDNLERVTRQENYDDAVEFGSFEGLPQEPWSQNKIEQIRQDFNNGMKYAELLQKYQCATSTVLKYCGKRGQKGIKKPALLGENNNSSKLTVEKVKEIKVLLSSGILSQRKIAMAYDVNPSSISDIKLGKTWSHVTID